MNLTDTTSLGRPDGGLYRAFWRWHFFAGLLVMPVLMLMALTGAIYLFKDEIEGVVYRPLLSVQARSAFASPQSWAAAAQEAVPGRLVQVVVPAEMEASAKLVIQTPQGRRDVFVDPHDARVLGAIPSGGVMQVVKTLHSLDIAGPAFNLLVELVAGWAIVMVATGLVLWWPRGRSGGVVTVRGAPGQRVFWRDLHAVGGVFVGGVIIFLAVTGMPWSAFWGKEVRNLTNAAGWGRPEAPAETQGWSHGPDHKAAPGGLPWALQGAEMPSMPAAPSLSLDAMVARIDASGLPRPYALAIPDKAGVAWSASYAPEAVRGMRTLYLDAATGRTLADIGYGQFGPAAKAIEWGISVHQGREFGLANKLVMLAGCLGVWGLGISGLVMWWKRRPRGRLAAPPRPLARGSYVALAAVVVPLALVYPLVGASLITVLSLDVLVQRFRMRRAPAGDGLP